MRYTLFKGASFVVVDKFDVRRISALRLERHYGNSSAWLLHLGWIRTVTAEVKTPEELLISKPTTLTTMELEALNIF